MSGPDWNHLPLLDDVSGVDNGMLSCPVPISDDKPECVPILYTNAYLFPNSYEPFDANDLTELPELDDEPPKEMTPDNRKTNKRETCVKDSIVEVEMSDPQFPDYRDTIHPAKVRKTFENKSRCKLLAFNGRHSTDVWPNSLVHPAQGGEEGKWDSWQKDQKVHIRIRNRRVRQRLVDRKRSEDGVWVKGTILNRTADNISVRIPNWETTDQYEEYNVKQKNDIRSAY